MGDGGVLEVLIDAGARVNIKDNEWRTPLHRASRCDHLVNLVGLQ